MPKLVLRKHKEADANWISVSDLMAGLMMVFLFILLIYVQTFQGKDSTCPEVPENCIAIINNLERNIAQLENRITLLIELKDEDAQTLIALEDELQKVNVTLIEAQRIVTTWRDIEYEIYRALQEEFANDLERWNAIILPETLTIKFLSPEILFETGSAELRPKFKSILNDFMPRYVRLLHGKFRDHIDEIRIEGHTSSEWLDSTDSKDAFIKNMNLSQARTRTVLEYSIQMQNIQDMASWMTKTVSANGMSSARLVLDASGGEDTQRSKRVEFKIKTKTSQVIYDIIDEILVKNQETQP